MEQLIKLREAKGLTQREVADYLKVGRTTYVKYETGDINLPLQSAIKLAEFYNISTDYLLGRSDIPNMESLQLFAEPAEKNQPPKLETEDARVAEFYEILGRLSSNGIDKALDIMRMVELSDKPNKP